MNTQAKEKTGKLENFPASASLSQDEMKQAIDRVLASKHFANAPMKQKFLSLICEFHLAGRGAELNEYLIGREVFNRDNSYNPATDPIVRVGAHGVREKLDRYYQKEGASDKVRIEIPVGCYEPSFVPVATQSFTFNSDEAQKIEPAPSMLSNTPPRKLIGKTELAFWPHAVAGILLLTIGGLLYWNFDLRRQVAHTTEERSSTLELYKPIWQPFLQSSDPTLVVLSNPPVFRFLNSADPEAIVKKTIPVSPEQLTTIFDELPNKSIIRIISNPRLTLTTDTYTGLGEATGLYRITELFRSVGESFSLKQSRTVSGEDLKNHNVIALGSVWVNNWSSNLPAKEEFVYTDQVTVLNLNPLPGEQAEYRASFDPQSGKLTEDYALITVTPNISSRNVVMVLSGLHSEGTAAAAEYLTGKQYLTELNQRLTKAGGGNIPKHYQALLKVSVENGISTFITLVTIHELGHPPK